MMMSIRLAAITSSLTRSIDLCFGQPDDHVARTTLLAMELAGALGAGSEELADVYWLGQLRFVGCTGHAHEVASLFGDEIATRADAITLDYGSAPAVLGWMIRNAGTERGGPARIQSVLRALAGGKRAAADSFRGGCEVGRELVTRLGLEPRLAAVLDFSFERWDGRGMPWGVSGDSIPHAMLVVHAAQELEVFARSGTETALAMARRRAGRAYAPNVAAAFVAEGAEILDRLGKRSGPEALLDAEPAPHVTVPAAGLDDVLTVLADFADLKSPFTVGHSRAVADLAGSAAEHLGLGRNDVVAVRRAGLVHDLGRCGVPNSIWDKPGELTDPEWEQVRLHPYRTERALAGSPLADLGSLASFHHERLNGSGYHRGVGGAQFPITGRILAAADVYQALTQPRSHRPAQEPSVAAAQLRDRVGAGAFETDTVEAVLTAAGHRTRRKRTKQWPAGLTAREVEVLRLLALGYTAKAIAGELVISTKTTAHHIEHIYTKIGVSTRGAAALWAAKHALV